MLKRMTMWRYKDERARWKRRAFALVLFAMSFFLAPTSVVAAEVQAKPRQIEVVLEEDGSLQIKEYWTVQYQKKLQGWTIYLPMRKKGQIDLNSFTVQEVVGEERKAFTRFEGAAYGASDVYLVVQNENAKEPEVLLTIYSEANAQDTKRFEVSYRAKDVAKRASDGIVVAWPIVHDKSPYAEVFTLDVRVANRVYGSAGVQAEGFVHGFGTEMVDAPIAERGGTLRFETEKFEEGGALEFVGLFPIDAAPNTVGVTEESVAQIREREMEHIAYRQERESMRTIWNYVQMGIVAVLLLFLFIALLASRKPVNRWTVESLMQQTPAMIQKALHGVISDTAINLTILHYVYRGQIGYRAGVIEDKGAEALREIAFPKSPMHLEALREWIRTGEGRGKLLAWAKRQNASIGKQVEKEKLYRILQDLRVLLVAGGLMAIASVFGALYLPSLRSTILAAITAFLFGVLFVFLYRKTGAYRAFYEAAFDFQKQARITLLDEMPEGGGIVGRDALETTIYALSLGMRPERIAAMQLLAEEEREMVERITQLEWFERSAHGA